MPIALTSEEIIGQKRSLANRVIKRGISGVYVLIQKNKIVYIGRGLDVGSRISSHACESLKKFDGFVFFECDLKKIKASETQMITKHQPKYNHRQKGGEILSVISFRTTGQEKKKAIAAAKKKKMKLADFMYSLLTKSLDEVAS